MQTPGLWPKVFLEFNICYSLISKLVVRYTHFSPSFFLAYVPLTISVLPVFQKWNTEKLKRPHLISIVLGMEEWGVTRKIRYCQVSTMNFKKKSCCNLSYHHRMLEIHFIFIHLYICIYTYIYTHIYMYYIYIIFLCNKYLNLGPWKNKMKMWATFKLI